MIAVLFRPRSAPPTPALASPALATIAAISLFVSAAAHAQWSVVNLHPAGSQESVAYGVANGQQVGYVRIGPTVGHTRASLWTGTAAWENLHPAGADYSTAFAVDAGVQAGEAVVGGFPHAARWSGASGTFVDLNPPGVFSSTAFAVSGGRPVGTAAVLGPHAILWSAGGTSYTDLNPPPTMGFGYTSEAYAALGTQQGGYVVTPESVISASIWSGSATPWVSLHPAGQISSWVYGLDATQQVGAVRVPDTSSHAALWRGSVVSWVDLHPFPQTNSRASAVANNQQVGYADVAGVRRASLWRGTAASRVDLHSFLSPGFTSSEANDIWSDGTATYVVGAAVRSGPIRYEAILWVGPAPCLADVNADGTVNSADFFDFLAAFFAVLPSADFNADSTINSADFFDFLAAFFAGCP